MASAFPRIGSEFLSPTRHQIFDNEGNNVAGQNAFAKQRRVSNPNLAKNDSYLNKFEPAMGQNSMGAAQTGATSGALLPYTEADSTEQNRKPSYQQFSSLMGGTTESASNLGRPAFHTKGGPELLRDPSVQINLQENLYIDDQADLMTKPTPKIATKLHTRRQSEGGVSESQQQKIRQIRKRDFLPTLGACRRIMQLEESDVPRAENPYRVEKSTERVLAVGERMREINKLDTQKYKLIQQIAQNKDYIDNLAKKRLNNRDDRTGIITDVKQLKLQGGVPHLPPHIVTRGGKQSPRSPSPTSSSLDVVSMTARKKLEPLVSRTRSVARAAGHSASLMPIMESIGAQISPARGGRDHDKSTFLTDLTPVAPKQSRFKTPSARMSVSVMMSDQDDLIPQTGLKYLQSGKMEKETVKDYINTSRLMLRRNLTNEARKKDLSQVKANYESEVQNLKKAEVDFEEDYQRFITMKADMDSLNQLQSEQLTAKLKNVQDLQDQIFLLENEDVSLYQRIKEQAEAIQGHIFCKRIVRWIDREWIMQLYDETKRKEYLHKLEMEAEALKKAGDLTNATKSIAHDLSSGLSRIGNKFNIGRQQVGQATFIQKGVDQNTTNSLSSLVQSNSNAKRRASHNLNTPMGSQKSVSDNLSPGTARNRAQGPASRRGSEAHISIVRRQSTIESNASRGRNSPLGMNTDIDSQHDQSQLTGPKNAGYINGQRNEEYMKKLKELENPDQMHLLQAQQVQENDDDLEEKIAALPDFPISIDRRDVWKLQEEYEQRNTRMVIDVNTGEYDLVAGNGGNSKKDAELSKKIQRVSETIDVLQKRKMDCDKRNAFFSAPKKAELATKQWKDSKKKKEKAVGMELMFPTDHPDVPSMIDSIFKLHSLLFDASQQTDAQQKADDFRNRPLDIQLQQPLMPSAPYNSMTAGSIEGGASLIEGNSLDSISNTVPVISRKETGKKNLTRDNTIEASLSQINNSQMILASQSDIPSAFPLSDVPGLQNQGRGSLEAQTDAMRRANRTIDEYLVRMLQQIEAQTMKQVELYSGTLERNKDNKKFQAQLNARKKELENVHREERLAAAKEREQNLREERKAKNLARMEKKKHVQANVYKRQTYRSPQPQIRVFKKKIEQTQDNVDLMKYLGFELDAITESNSEGRMLASRGSMRSNSVPN